MINDTGHKHRSTNCLGYAGPKATKDSISDPVNARSTKVGLCRAHKVQTLQLRFRVPKMVPP